MADDLIIDNATGEVLDTVKDLDKQQREDLADEVSSELEADKAEVEMRLGYREIEIEPYGKLHIHKPTVDDDYYARLAYSDTFTDLMMNSKLKTIEEMEKMQKARGDEVIDSDTIKEIQKDFSETAAELMIARDEYKKTHKPTSKRKVKQLEQELADLRKDLFKKEAIRNKYVNLTIEGMADQRQLVEKMYRCVLKPDGKRVWETPEDLMKEKDSEPVANIVYEFISFTRGIDPRVLRNIPDLLEQIGDDVDLDT